MGCKDKIIVWVSVLIGIAIIFLQIRQWFGRMASQNEWRTYENAEYEYRLRYPAGIYLVTDAPGTLSGAGDLHMGALYISSWRTSKFRADDQVGLEVNRLAALDAKLFAEAVREYQVAARSAKNVRRQVGDLRQISFAGTTAYSFTLTDGFASPFVEYSLSGVHVYILLGHGDAKYIIHYPVWDRVASQISRSFEFTSAEQI